MGDEEQNQGQWSFRLSYLSCFCWMRPRPGTGHMKHEDELCFSLAACFRMLTANQAQTTSAELTRPHLAFLLGAVEVPPKRPSTAYAALLESRSPPAPARRSPALPCSTGAKHLARHCLAAKGGRAPLPGECGNGEWAVVGRESDGVWALGFGVTGFIRPRNNHTFLGWLKGQRSPGPSWLHDSVPHTLSK
jgi:hypothetical protein